MVLPLLNFNDGQKVFGNSVSERLTQVQMCPQKSSQLRITYILPSNTADEVSSGGSTGNRPAGTNTKRRRNNRKIF